jgi:hypothetical protein
MVLVLCVVALVILGSQLNAGPQPVAAPTVADSTALPLVVGTTFPEPISTVFILAGAAALGLWKLAQKLKLV